MNVANIDKLAKIVLLITIVLLPFIAVPSSLLSVSPIVKMAFFVTGICAVLVVWALARFADKTLFSPKSWLLGSGLFVIGASAISAVMSDNFVHSFTGSGFERDTVFMYLVLLVTIYCIALVYNRISDLIYLQLGIVISFVVLTTVQLLRILIGSDVFFPNLFSSNSSTTLLGSWNDLAIFSGLVAIVSAVAIVKSYFAGWVHRCMYIVLGVALCALILVNMEVVWGVLTSVLLLFGAYIVWCDKPQSVEPVLLTLVSKRKRLLLKLAPVLVVAGIGITSVLFGSTIEVSEIFGVDSIDVRPSWEGTVEIGKEVYSEDAFFGTGPNTFDEQWSLYRSQEINQTALWNVDFTFGIGIIPTMFITGGIITALAWILFFGTFIFAGLKLVTRKISNPSVSYLSVSFYLMALYLWLVSIFYVPQFTMFIFAGITTGAFISISNIAGFAKNKKIELQKKTYKRYLVTIGLVCVIVLSLYTASSVGTRAGAFVYLKQSTNSIASADIAAAESYLEQANLLYHGAAGDQVQANISLLKLGLAEELRQQGVSVDENQTADEINRAINSARSAVGKNPRSYANWLLLAGVYEGLIRYGVENAGSNAQDAYIAAQKLSPQDPSIRLRKARLEIMLGNNDAAREYINNAIDLKEDYVGAYYVLSQLEITEDNIGEAIIATEQSVLLAPSNPTFLFQLGILLYSAQEYEKTILVLERLLSIRNDYANALYYIGLAYEFEGQQEKTIEAFLKIKLLNPDNLHVQDIISSLQEGGTAREVVEAGGPNAISQVVDLEESLPESDEINL